MALEKPGSGTHQHDEKGFLYQVPETQVEPKVWREKQVINCQGREHGSKERDAKPTDPKREQHSGDEKKEWRFTSEGAENDGGH
jgi:hypothetical protein